MNFKQGDKVKIISKGSYYVGATGTVVSEGVDGAYRVQIEQPAPKYSGFDTMGIISGFFESEIELVDSEREALIELAETLDKARKQANASGQLRDRVPAWSLRADRPLPARHTGRDRRGR